MDFHVMGAITKIPNCIFEKILQNLLLTMKFLNVKSFQILMKLVKRVEDNTGIFENYQYEIKV